MRLRTALPIRLRPVAAVLGVVALLFLSVAPTTATATVGRTTPPGSSGGGGGTCPPA